MDTIQKEYVVGFYMGFYVAGTVLLIEKKRPAWQVGKLNGIGGKVENDEKPVDAMVREFEEETGVKVEADRWDLFCVLRGNGFRIWFFRSDQELGERPRTVTDEVVGWYLPKGYPKEEHLPVIPNLRWLLPMADRRQQHDWPFDIRERANE